MIRFNENYRFKKVEIYWYEFIYLGLILTHNRSQFFLARLLWLSDDGNFSVDRHRISDQLWLHQAITEKSVIKIAHAKNTMNTL